ncbi:hypothetical protein [Amycolatopsis sp. lyj-112]|uniref:hypothetical protein n=1 Tax=Amycolatopsis sp. lyj-112 TaxID=2789288 RepID=UPI00397ABCF6
MQRRTLDRAAQRDLDQRDAAAWALFDEVDGDLAAGDRPGFLPEPDAALEKVYETWVDPASDV